MSIFGGPYKVDGKEYLGIVSFQQDGKQVERVFLPCDPRWDENGEPWKSNSDIQAAVEKSVRKVLAKGITLK